MSAGSQFNKPIASPRTNIWGLKNTVTNNPDGLDASTGNCFLQTLLHILVHWCL